MASHSPVEGRQIVPIMALIALAYGGQAAAQQDRWNGRGGPLFWGNVDVGFAAVSQGSEPLREYGRNHAFFALEGGVRLNREWLLGVGGYDVDLGSIDCAPQDTYCGNLRGSFNQLQLITVYNPRQGHWLLQAAAGRAWFEIDDGPYTAAYTHDGWGGQVGVGYDWAPWKSITHFGVRASWAWSKLGTPAGAPGTLSHSMLGLGLAVSWY